MSEWPGDLLRGVLIGVLLVLVLLLALPGARSAMDPDAPPDAGARSVQAVP